MKVVELNASKRTLLGKSVKRLRRQGVTPAHLFGRNFESVPLQVETAMLESVLAGTGTGHLLSLAVDGPNEKHDVIIKELQKDIFSRKAIHVDFYKVSATEKLELDVPVTLVGEAPALKQKLGNLIMNLKAVRVSCLPKDIPYNVPVDIGKLAAIGDTVVVGDLKLPEGVTVVTDPKEMIVKVTPLRVEEERVVKEAEAKVEGEKAAEEAPKAEESGKPAAAKEPAKPAS